MKKLNKKKILLLIILIILIIIEIKAGVGSKANKVLEITANMIDNSGLLSDETCKIQAVSEKESGMAITLPNIINQKKVEKYIVDVKQIDQNSDTQEVTVNQQERNPGEKVYLSEEEIKNEKIDLKVKYETKEKSGQILYNKVIEEEVEEHKITLTGFMPNNAKLKVEKVDNQKVEETVKPHMTSNTNLDVAYDITIMIDDKEYEPKDVDETINVSISGLENNEGKNKNYRIIHIDDQNKTEEIQDVKKVENIITFNANEFSTYAVLSEEDTTTTEEISMQEESIDYGIATYSVVGDTISENADVWDGTIATEFEFGDGTRRKAIFNYKC